METIFVAYHFTDANRLLVSQIDNVCYAQGIRLISGEILGGQALGIGVRERLDGCDALIAVADQVVQLAAPNMWHASQWVRDEFGHAVANSLPAIALVETGVEWQGMHRDHERIDFDRTRPTDALLRLANTIGYWRQRAGRRLKLRIELNGVPANHIAEIKYRCLYKGIEDPTWRASKVIQEPGAAFVFVNNVRSEDHAIELEARTFPPIKTLKSVATPQVVPISLREE